MERRRPGFLGSTVVLGVVVGAILLAVQGRSVQELSEAERRPVPRAASPVAEPPEEESVLEVEVPVAEEAPGTPPVEESVAEVDGLLELRVLARGQPVPRAQVRLYRRSEHVSPPGESPEAEPRPGWRLAATAATGDDGRLELPTRPGDYLMTVRAKGFTRVLRDVARPEGEARTPVEVGLSEELTLSGRTLMENGAPLSEVELMLTPYGRANGMWRRVELPVEERVSAVSDARGRFLLEGLAPGLYRMELRLPGQELEEVRLVWVPTEELELVLPSVLLPST